MDRDGEGMLGICERFEHHNPFFSRFSKLAQEDPGLLDAGPETHPESPGGQYGLEFFQIPQQDHYSIPNTDPHDLFVSP